MSVNTNSSSSRYRAALVLGVLGIAALLVTPFAPMLGAADKVVRLTPDGGAFWLAIGGALAAALCLVSRRFGILIVVGVLTTSGAIFLFYLTAATARDMLLTHVGWGAPLFPTGGMLVGAAGVAGVRTRRAARPAV